MIMFGNIFSFQGKFFGIQEENPHSETASSQAKLTVCCVGFFQVETISGFQCILGNEKMSWKIVIVKTTGAPDLKRNRNHNILWVLAT